MGFSSPPDPDFFKAQVWDIVCKIPLGKVASYGQVAKLVPLPAGLDPDAYAAQAPRWVGGAMAACPPGVPWQRVVNAQGKISLPGASAERQRELLEAEGVIFDAHGRIDMKKYGWQGSDIPIQPRLWE